MGAIRSLPQNEPNTLTQTKEQYYFITVYVCGWQHFMQDFEVSITDGKQNLFAIIDGHNGPEVAQICRVKLDELFRKNELIKMGQTLIGMENIIYELEDAIYNSHAQINQIRKKNNMPLLAKQQTTRAGCSIMLAAISQEQIIIGNVGLCRCYVTYKKDKSKAILFSGNHIPSNKQEQVRITRNNGFIYNGKVNGIFPYTRSIGDFHLKKNTQGKYKKDKAIINQGLITSEPSLFSLRKQDISSVLLGSSGIWQRPQLVGKVMSSLGRSVQKDEQQLQNMLTKMIAAEPTQQKIGLQNMTVTYINFTN